MEQYNNSLTKGMADPYASPMQTASSSDFIDKINQLPEPQRSQMLAKLSQDYAGQGALLKEDMSRAQALRDTPTPEGRVTRNNIYTAANPLEHIGAGIKNYRGMQDMRKAREAQGALSGDLSSANRSILDILRGNSINKLEYAP